MWNKIKPYVLAFLTIIAFFAEYESIYNGKIFKATNPFPFCIGIVPLSICYILILNMYKKENTKLESIGMKLLSILFSFLMVMGNSYIKVLSSKLVFGNPLMIFISILAFFGYLPVISIILNILPGSMIIESKNKFMASFSTSGLSVKICNNGRPKTKALPTEIRIAITKPIFKLFNNLK